MPGSFFFSRCLCRSWQSTLKQVVQIKILGMERTVMGGAGLLVIVLGCERVLVSGGGNGRMEDAAEWQDPRCARWGCFHSRL